MGAEVMTDDSLLRECREMADRAKAASRLMAVSSGKARSSWLIRAGCAIEDNVDEILAANAEDVKAAPGLGLNQAAIDRLTLDRKGIEKLRGTMFEVEQLPDPLGEVIRGERRPNGLEVRQIRVPLGVVFMMYESRPNVTVDAAALCIKSGNAVILRGGKEAIRTNLALHRAITAPEVMDRCGLDADDVQLVETTDRTAVGHLLRMPDRIDLAIPRGGESLIRRVAEEARMPVLKHYHGICHVYVDAAADPVMAVAITVNSKVQRPGVCNAAETLLVHRDIAARFLPMVASALRSCGVELRGDSASRAIFGDMVPATEEDWTREYLDLILAVRVVDSLDDAIDHIAHYGSGHTDAIVTNDLAASRRFVSEVDSAAVIVNASTRFNDGGELGLGTEIGISTDKVHARGPCGLRELTSTKWVVEGEGQVRC